MRYLITTVSREHDLPGTTEVGTLGTSNGDLLRCVSVEEEGEQLLAYWGNPDARTWTPRSFELARGSYQFMEAFVPKYTDEEVPPPAPREFHCYDCGSTLPKHHTALCEFAAPEEGDILDLPALPGTQWWIESPGAQASLARARATIRGIEEYPVTKKALGASFFAPRANVSPRYTDKILVGQIKPQTR